MWGRGECEGLEGSGASGGWGTMLASGTTAGWWGGAAVCMVWMVAGVGGDTHPSSSAQSWLRGPKLRLLQRGFQHEQAVNGMSFQVPRAA